jgi:hypothetical protein
MDRLAAAPQAPHRAFGLASLIQPQGNGLPSSPGPSASLLVDQTRDVFTTATAALVNKRCDGRHELELATSPRGVRAPS